MDYEYISIRKLFQLKKPMSLPEDQIQKIRDILHAKIPKSLENYYKICGGCKEMNSAQDFLLTPDGRYGSYSLENFIYQDFFVFYVENQCVNLWGFRKIDAINEEDDPKVYESLDNGKTWQLTGETISQNLISHALMHFIFSVEYSCEDFYKISTKQIKQLQEHILSLEHANIYQYNKSHYLQPFDDTIIMIQCDSVSDEADLYFSSRDEQHFNVTEKIIYDIMELKSDSEE